MANIPRIAARLSADEPTVGSGKADGSGSTVFSPPPPLYRATYFLDNFLRTHDRLRRGRNESESSNPFNMDEPGH